LSCLYSVIGTIQIENLQSEKTVTASGGKILQNVPVLNDVNLQLSENKLTEMCGIQKKTNPLLI